MNSREIFLERVDELKAIYEMGNYPFEMHTGLANGTLKRIYNGGRPTVETVLKIAKACDVTTDYLLGIEEYPTKKCNVSDLPFIKNDNAITNPYEDPICKYVPWEIAEDLPKDFFEANDNEKENSLYLADRKHLECYCFNDEEESCTYYLICKYEKVLDDTKKRVFFYWYSDFFSVELLEKETDRLTDFYEYLHKKFLKEQRKIMMNKNKR